MRILTNAKEFCKKILVLSIIDTPICYTQVMNKSYVLLCMCEKLKGNHPITIDGACRDYGISVPTFRRYISTLRDFFWDTFQIEIVYDGKKKEYSCESSRIDL